MAQLVGAVIGALLLVAVITDAAQGNLGSHGLAALVDHLFGVPVTGASVTPARSFGPALVAGAWENHWIFWVGPLIEGALAALVYEFVFIRRKETAE